MEKDKKEDKSDWDKKLAPRKANIGFLTKTDAFSEPTPAEKAAALAIETESWQKVDPSKFNASGWKSAWKISAPYSVAKGAGKNLLADRECGQSIKDIRHERAIEAFMKTPMDKGNILKNLGYDIERYEKPSMKKKIKRYLKAKDPGFWEDLLMKFMPLIVVGLMTCLIYFLTGRMK